MHLTFKKVRQYCGILYSYPFRLLLRLLPTFVVDALYRTAYATPKAARTESNANDVGTPYPGGCVYVSVSQHQESKYNDN